MIILYITGWCLGLSTITQPNKIGFFIRKFLEKINLPYLTNPILLCPECMASFWGTILYFSLGGTISIMYPISLLCASFLNGLLWKLYGYLNRMNKQFDELDELKN